VTDELEAIRARHEADEQAAEEGDGVPPLRLIAAHIDRGDLLRLLDAAREELREVKEAAQDFVDLSLPRPLPTTSLHYQAAHATRLAILRAALAKDAPPTRAQGESS
jgi:hypothetical protein